MSTLQTRLRRVERTTAERRRPVKVVLFLPLDDNLIRNEGTGEVITEAEFARRYPDAIELAFDDTSEPV